MSRQEDRAITTQYVINFLMAANNDWLVKLEELENESLMMDKRNQSWLKKIECLLTQIEQDNSRGDKRSAFRKVLLLKGLLRIKLE